MNAFKTLFIGAALTAALAACKKEEVPPPPVVVAPPPAVVPAPMPAPAPAPIEVTGITFGKAVGPDMNVTAPTTSFDAKDTIYAAVATKNANPSATLAAKWSYQDGQVVHEDSVTIAPTGDAVTDFHINSPKGFPPGKYQLEVSLNGQPATTLGFDIK
jgi:hypothetical protein